MGYLEKKRKMLNALGRTDGVCIGVDCKDCPLYCDDCFTLEMKHPKRVKRIVKDFLKERGII